MWENEYEAYLRDIGVVSMQNNVKYEISDIKDEGLVMKKGNVELLALLDDVKFLIVIIVIVMIRNFSVLIKISKLVSRKNAWNQNFLPEEEDFSSCILGPGAVEIL
jgi:hypothetical protein